MEAPVLSEDKRSTKFGTADAPGHPFFVEGLTQRYTFATYDDTDEILVYRDGAYREGAESLIRGEIESHYRDLKSSAKQQLVNEVVHGVQRRTYVSRKSFNPPRKLCLANGVLDVDTLIVGPHAPHDRFTIQLPVQYDPKAECPRFLRFVEEVLPEPDARNVAQMWTGYLIKPGNWLQRILMHVGAGNNGKSTFLGVQRDLLGPENVAGETLQRLSENRFSTARLYGKLANISADIPAKPIRYTGIVKMLTGGDLIPAEHKNQKGFDFVNQAKLEFSCNELPEVSDRTYAFWRRWIVLRWPVDFTGKEDRFLPEKLGDELPGILNWALEGLRMLEREGDFPKTATTEAIMLDWKQRSDSLYWFVSENVEVDAKSDIERDFFYESYVGFCEDHQARVKTREVVGAEIRNLIPSVRLERPRREGSRPWCFAGIRWKPPFVLKYETPGPPRPPGPQGRQDVLPVKAVRAVQATPLSDKRNDQDPDFMIGLERALQIRRYDPKRPVPFVVGDLVKDLRSRGHEPNVDQLTAGVIKGMMPEAP
jgi:putative DNA primase/helicase